MLNNSKHDNLIRDLEERLRYSPIDYDLHTEFRFPHGEADLIAFHRNYVLIFEVKSNKHHKATKKARSQLVKARSYFRHGKGYLFEVYGNTDGSYTIDRFI